MINKENSRILLLGKANDLHCQKAINFLQMISADLTVATGDWGDAFPDAAMNWEGDYIISYLSRWIVPDWLLNRARIAAINFHPAPPSYPGTGCVNFALYDQCTEYGVTCHHMSPSVDTGQVIAVRHLPVYSEDSVTTLLSRTYDALLMLFYEIADKIYQKEPLPESALNWSRKPYTRNELESLYELDISMGSDEIARRIRATSYGEFQPRLKFQGYNFIVSNSPPVSGKDT